MKKLLALTMFSLMYFSSSFASCGLAKKLDATPHWSGDSAWRLEFFNHNSEAITVTMINYYSSPPISSQQELYRSYKVNIRVNGNSERSYVHSTNMNYDLVKSFNVSCVKASSGSNYKSLGTNKKESWFKWWYLIFAIPILGLFIQANEDKNKKKSQTQSTNTSKSSSAKNSSDTGNLIEDVWEGRKTLAETFWLYYFILNGIISVGAGFLAEMNDNNIFLIAAIASNVWAGVGTWKSSTNYQLQKIKAKLPYGWAYAAKIMIVLNFLTIAGQGTLLLAS
jgi:hypothetical protein